MKSLWPILSVAVLTAILTRELFPRRVELPAPPPQIITVRDTVRDTLVLRVPGPGRVTTDTVQLTIRETVYDTVRINIGCDAAQRTDIWPVLSLEVGRARGDTTVITTYSNRTGQGGVARIWTPGPLLGVWARDSLTPRLAFGELPPPYRVKLWDKAKWTAIGYGTCTVANGLRGLLTGRN